MKGNAAINQNKQQAMNILEANGDVTGPSPERMLKDLDYARTLDEAMGAE